MTPTNAPSGQPTAFENAMALNRRDRIGRAGWLKPAHRWQQGRNKGAITVNETQQQDFHGQ